MDEAKLKHKLQLIERLHVGATTDGERMATSEARRRIQARLSELERTDPPVEYRFSLTDPWSRKLFLALLRRYDLRPYRYPRQRHTTVMVRVPERFLDETLWPEFEQLDQTLRAYLSDVTSRVIADAIHADDSEAAEVGEAARLPAGD